MAAIDDFKAAVAAEDTLIDQAVAFIAGTPAIVAAAVALQAASNDTALASLQSDVQAHADALTTALAPSTVTATTPAVPPIATV
jgi:hypothetical protein